MIGAEDGETEIFGRRQILWYYMVKNSLVSLLSSYKKLAAWFPTGKIWILEQLLTPIDLVGILINGFPNSDNNNKKEVKTKTVQMQPSGVAFSTAKV